MNADEFEAVLDGVYKTSLFSACVVVAMRHFPVVAMECDASLAAKPESMFTLPPQDAVVLNSFKDKEKSVEDVCALLEGWIETEAVQEDEPEEFLLKAPWSDTQRAIMWALSMTSFIIESESMRKSFLAHTEHFPPRSLFSSDVHGLNPFDQDIPAELDALRTRLRVYRGAFYTYKAEDVAEDTEAPEAPPEDTEAPPAKRAKAEE